MKITEGPLKGLLIIEPRVFKDDRGYFYESFQDQRYREAGIPPFVQDNVSRSKINVIRGLHYQFPHAQGKLVSVTKGEAFDVVVDIRLNSPTFGKSFSIILNDQNHLQFYIPPGFAHGFCALSPETDFNYKCTAFYHPESEHGIIWNDEALNIAWPATHPILSAKDETYSKLREISHDKLFS